MTFSWVMIMKKYLILLMLLSVSIAYAVPVQWAGNDHYYDKIEGNMNWTDAKIDAESKGGYLATVTSLQENNFITSTFGTPVTYYLLGGFQNPGVTPASAGWQWVDGEVWSFTYWDIGVGEPNDWSGHASEQILMMKDNGRWNDGRDNFSAPAYIIEYDEPVEEEEPVIPEFNAINILLVIMITGLGTVLIIKKKSK